MTITYWYHYGAVILWPKSRHSELINTRYTDIRLNWLNYYLKNWADPSLEPEKKCKRTDTGFIQIGF